MTSGKTQDHIPASMQVRLWGTRGSLPAPLAPAQVESRIRSVLERFAEEPKQDISKFLEQLPTHEYGGYGGNTPCIEVSVGDDRLIIDAGSGLRTLGYDLMRGPCGRGQGEVHLLFTHFHWDHLIGLPFFTPIFIPGNRIHAYAVQPELADVFPMIFRKPFFPVELRHLGAKIESHALSPREPRQIGPFRVTPYRLDHPDPCWGYRIEHGGRSFAYCVDTEGTRVSVEQLGEDLPLYRDADLMVFDGQYTLMETMEKVNWGHATAAIGLEIALREGVKKVVFMHHDPASSDAAIASASQQVRLFHETRRREAARTGQTLRDVEWCFAIEGTAYEV